MTCCVMLGNCQAHLTMVGDLLTKACLGEPSLQNSIEMAVRALKLVLSLCILYYTYLYEIMCD